MIQLIPIPTCHYYLRDVMVEAFYPEYRDYDGPLLEFIEQASRTEVTFRYQYDIMRQPGLQKFLRAHIIGTTVFGPVVWGKAKMLHDDYLMLLNLVQEFIDEIVVPRIIEDTVERIVSNNLEIWEQVGHS
jgi:hypothetical protein